MYLLFHFRINKLKDCLVRGSKREKFCAWLRFLIVAGFVLVGKNVHFGKSSNLAKKLSTSSSFSNAKNKLTFEETNKQLIDDEGKKKSSNNRC